MAMAHPTYNGMAVPGMQQNTVQVRWPSQVSLPMMYPQLPKAMPSYTPAVAGAALESTTLPQAQVTRMFVVRHPDDPERIVQWMTHADAKLFFKHKVKATCPSCRSNTSTTFCYLKNIKTCKADDLEPRYICSGCQKEFSLFKKPKSHDRSHLDDRKGAGPVHKRLCKREEAPRWAPYPIDAPAMLGGNHQPTDNFQTMQSAGQDMIAPTSNINPSVNMYGNYQALAHGLSYSTLQVSSIGAGSSNIQNFSAQEQAPSSALHAPFSSDMVAATSMGLNKVHHQVYGGLSNPNSCLFGPSTAGSQHIDVPNHQPEAAGWAPMQPIYAMHDQISQQLAPTNDSPSRSPLMSSPVLHAPMYRSVPGTSATDLSALVHQQGHFNGTLMPSAYASLSLACTVPMMHSLVSEKCVAQRSTPCAGQPQHPYQAEGPTEFEAMHVPQSYSKDLSRHAPVMEQQPPVNINHIGGAPSSQLQAHLASRFMAPAHDPPFEPDAAIQLARLQAELDLDLDTELEAIADINSSDGSPCAQQQPPVGQLGVAPPSNSEAHPASRLMAPVHNPQLELDAAILARLKAELELDTEVVAVVDNRSDGSPPPILCQASGQAPEPVDNAVNTDTERLNANGQGNSTDSMSVDNQMIRADIEHIDPLVHPLDLAGSLNYNDQEQASIRQDGVENMELAIPCMELKELAECSADHNILQQGYLNPFAFQAEVTRQLEEVRTLSMQGEIDDEPDDAQLFCFDEISFNMAVCSQLVSS